MSGVELVLAFLAGVVMGGALDQGDVAHPNTKIQTIAAAVASGVNMNEWVHESIECSGAGPEPYTDAQFESVARLVVAAHKATGLPINRSTVVVHADINNVSRRSDPWPPATREARVKRVVARANAHPTRTLGSPTRPRARCAVADPRASGRPAPRGWPSRARAQPAAAGGSRYPVEMDSSIVYVNDCYSNYGQVDFLR